MLNPYDPYGLWSEWHPPRSSAPIVISARRGDGLTMIAGREQVSLRGVSEGTGRGVSVSLDGTLFTLDTGRGWTASTCARRLAAKVNASARYVAIVDERAGGVVVRFARR